MSTNADILAEIEVLSGLDLCDLRERFLDFHGCKAPVHMSRQLLIQAIAYQIQCKAYGGLSASSQRVLMNGNSGGGSKRGYRMVHRRYKPGTQFLRDWQGRTHVVTVNDDGASVHQGTVFGSLSKVARAITGTRWSGPAYFGLTGDGERSHG